MPRRIEDYVSHDQNRQSGISDCRQPLRLRPLLSTRFGGVSEGHLASLNLGTHRGDVPENVRENYRILGAAVGFAPEQTVFTRQEHTDTILRVGKERLRHGSFPSRPSFATASSPMSLAWRSAASARTAQRFCCSIPRPVHSARCTPVGAARPWASRPKPSPPCAANLAVTPPASAPPSARALASAASRSAPKCRKRCRNALGADAEPFFEPRGEKYHVDLKGLNRLWLERAGLSEVDVCPDCTKCQPERFWSHRAVGNQRGSQAAIIMRKE